MKSFLVYLITFKTLLSLCPCIVTFSNECDTWSKNHIFLMNNHQYFNYSSILIKFNSFDELGPNCATNQSEIIAKENINRIKLYATRAIFLESNFNIQPLIHMFNLTSKQSKRPIELFNLKGFNFNSNYSFVPNFQSKIRVQYVEFVNFNFDFYLNERKIVDKEVCLSLREHLRWKKLFLPPIINMNFKRKIFYSKTICPFIFMNSPAKSMSLFEITNSLIYKNQLEFLDLNETAEFDMSFTNLALDMAYERITHRLVEKFVFKNMQVLSLNGLIYAIQTDFFAFFSKIKVIYINVDNFQIFFHKGLKWLDYINLSINVSLNETELAIRKARYDLNFAVHFMFHEQSSLFRKTYDYSNRDLCLFKDFPHRRLVYPTIFTGELIECSCTLIWMIQYSKFYFSKNFTLYRRGLWVLEINELKSKSMVVHCILERGNLTQEIEKCNFESSFQKCDNFNLIANEEAVGFFDEKNIVFQFKWLKYIVEVYIQPVLCLLGIFTNLMTIKVIRNRQNVILRKSFDNSMYKHQLACSVFNIVLCTIKILSLMNICIFPRTSFCSSVNEEAASQYFKIYVVIFLGNAVRLGSNFSYIFFSISRLYLMRTKPSKYFVKFDKINLKIFYSLLVAFCLSFSSFSIFQFKVNDFFDVFEQNFPFDAYAINWCEDEKTFKPGNLLSLCKLFTVFNLINKFLQNILFFFVSIIIDLNLMHLSNENLKSKKKVFPANEAHIDEALRFREKINKMILVNGFFYFLSHFPEFLITVLLIVFRQKLEYYCFTLFSCVDLIEMAQSLNFVLIFLQFFLFKKFDRNFSNSFQHLWERAFSKT
jgi:hypothetical protein